MCSFLVPTIFNILPQDIDNITNTLLMNTALLCTVKDTEGQLFSLQFKFVIIYTLPHIMFSILILLQN